MLVSVITATYNCQNTVERSLESVSAQRNCCVEQVVIDGGSTDETTSRIRKHERSIAVFKSEEDNGLYDALNKGIALSHGEVIGFLHSDDVFFADDVIESVVKTFETTKCDFLYGNIIYVDKQSGSRTVRNWKSGRYRRGKLNRGWMPPHPSTFVKRSVVEAVGPFDLQYRISADYDFLLRVLKMPGIKVAYLNRVITRMRVGGMSNGSLRNIVKKMREDSMIIAKNKAGGLLGLSLKTIRKLPQFLSR
jgi:glycosyltransferase